jgi:outer membrane protein OmpA-like peptidoglycan-associated protein
MTEARDTRRWALRGSLIAALLAGAALSGACGPGPKGPSLMELEALRESNYTRQIRIDPSEVTNPRVQEIRTQAHDTIAESDHWYDSAIAAWQNAEKDKAEELATQGILLYRAAEAYAHAADARERIEDANATYQTQLERRNQYNDMVAANEEVIELLTALQRLFDQTSECRAELAGMSAQGQAQEQARHALLQARFQQREAETHRANDWATQLYNEGVQLVNNSAQYIDAQQYDLANSTATLAVSRFQEAMTQTASQFQDLQQSMLHHSGNQALFEAAVAAFGDGAFVDARGLVVVIPGLFAERRSDIRNDKTYLLDALADLINQHHGINVTVEGHTSDQGNHDSNVTLSRDRADAVVQYLTQHDVRSSRLTSNGLGEDYPRYPNTADSRTDNDRVEVVFNLQQ